MFPVVLDLSQVSVVLAGNGPAAARRYEQIRAGGATNLTVFAPTPCAALAALVGPALISRWPTQEEIHAAGVLFLADLPPSESDRLAAIARAVGTFVNSEDDRANCDVHVPAMVRRGDLLLTVSTNGQSPGMARYIRQRLEADFGPEWAARLERLAALRSDWKAEGLGIPELSRRTNAFLEGEGLPLS